MSDFVRYSGNTCVVVTYDEAARVKPTSSIGCYRVAIYVQNQIAETFLVTPPVDLVSEFGLSGEKTLASVAAAALEIESKESLLIEVERGQDGGLILLTEEEKGVRDRPARVRRPAGVIRV